MDTTPPQHAGLCGGEADWRTVQCGHVVDQQNLITIDSEASMEKACHILITHRISSAPVYDEANHTYVGMFDYTDLLTYVLLVLKRARISEQENTKEVLRLVQQAAAEQAVPVRLASDLSRHNPFYTLMAESSLLQALEIFARGAHRVAITDQTGKVQAVLSQSAAIRYLGQQIGRYPSLDACLARTLADHNIHTGEVVSTEESDTVLDALSKMKEHNVSSIAVLDAHRRIIGNISVSDIKHVLARDKHALLYSQCHNFISHVKMEDGLEHGMDSVPVFDVHLNTTLRGCLNKLVATKAHRVWISDDQRRVMGVVSLTDISGILAKHAGI